MKLNTLFISFFLAFTLFNTYLLAQRNIGKIQTFYDGLLASALLKKQVNFKLKGNIKQVIEHSALKKDSIILQFNNKGILEKEINSETKEITAYIFNREREQLKAIFFENNYSKSQKQFDGSGLVVKEVFDSKNTTDTFHREALFSYNDDLSELKISYSYNRDTSKYDLVLFDDYKFMFNANMQISEEQQHSRRSHQTFLDSYYGTVVKYKYYLTSGLLKHVKSTEICPTQNSCSSLEISIAYDNRGNITSQSLSDQTIRNSNWSSSYSYSAKYNENNDIIEEYYSDHDDAQKYLRETFVSAQDKNKSKKTSVAIETAKLYVYENDSNGNWIKKYEIINKNRKLIKSRVIEYYN